MLVYLKGRAREMWGEIFHHSPDGHNKQVRTRLKAGAPSESPVGGRGVKS